MWCMLKRDPTPNEKKFLRNRGIQWYAKPQFRLVFMNRGSQTVYSVFINHQLPRHENTAVLDGEKKPNKRSDSRGGCTPFCGALIENRM